MSGALGSRQAHKDKGKGEVPKGAAVMQRESGKLVLNLGPAVHSWNETEAAYKNVH